MDFISTPSLHEYFLLRKESVSMMTKLYFSLIISHGLRYLQEYKIAHLDLKPTNIMTHFGLKLKIIDFGESYHPFLKSTFGFI